MKQGRLYRFNIQFTAQSDAEERAGDFLDSLARRKSTVIVAAVIEYMQNHPEMLSDPRHIQVSTISPDQLEATIRAIIEEKFSNLPANYHSTCVPAADEEQLHTDIADMLDDLELFSNF